MIRLFLSALIMFMLALPIMAFDWEQHGFTVQDEVEKDEGTEISMVSDRGFDVVVRYRGTLGKLEANRVLQAVNQFSTWNNMVPASMHFTLGDKDLSLVVMPLAIAYGETDLLPFIPAGMYFVLEEVPAYNFRIKVEDYFIRIDGSLLSENILLKKIHDAQKDPLGYLETNNPRYMITKIHRQEKEIEQLRHALIARANRGFSGAFKPVDKEIITRVVHEKETNPDATAKIIFEKMKNEKIAVSHDEVKIILGVYFGEFN